MVLFEHCVNALQVLSGVVVASPETLRGAEVAVTQWAKTDPEYAKVLANILISGQATSPNGGRQCAILAAVLLRQFVNRYTDRFVGLDDETRAGIEGNAFKALVSANAQNSPTFVEERQSTAALLASIVLVRWGPETVSTLTSRLQQVVQENADGSASGVVAFFGATVNALRVSGNDNDDESEEHLLLLLRSVMLVGDTILSWPIPESGTEDATALARLNCQVDLAGVFTMVLDCLRPEESITGRQSDPMMDKTLSAVIGSQGCAPAFIGKLYALLQDAELAESWITVSHRFPSSSLSQKIIESKCLLLYQVARSARMTAVIVGAEPRLEDATLTLFNRLAMVSDLQHSNALEKLGANQADETHQVTLYTVNGTVITFSRFAACVISLFDLVVTEVSSDRLKEQIGNAIPDLVTERVCKFAQLPISYFVGKEVSVSLSADAASENFSHDGQDLVSSAFDPIRFIEDEEDSQDFVDSDNPRVVTAELLVHLIDAFDCQARATAVLLEWAASLPPPAAPAPARGSDLWRQSVEVAAAREGAIFLLGSVFRGHMSEGWAAGNEESGDSSNEEGQGTRLLTNEGAQRCCGLLTASLSDPWPLVRARGMCCVSLLLSEDKLAQVPDEVLRQLGLAALAVTDRHVPALEGRVAGQALVARAYALRTFAHVMARAEEEEGWGELKAAVGQMAGRVAREASVVSLGLSVDTVHFALETLSRILRACPLDLMLDLQNSVVEVCGVLWPLVHHDWFVREVLGELVDSLVLSLGELPPGDPRRTWTAVLAGHVKETIFAAASSEDVIAVGNCLGFYHECLQRCSSGPAPSQPVESELVEVLPLVVVVAESARTTMQRGLPREDATQVIRLSCLVTKILVRNTPNATMQLVLPANSCWSRVLPQAAKGPVSFGVALQSLLVDWVIGSLAKSLQLGDGELVEGFESNWTVGASSNMGQCDTDEDLASSNADVTGDPDGLGSDLTEVAWALAQELFAKSVHYASEEAQCAVFRGLKEVLDNTSDVRVATSIMGMVGWFVATSDSLLNNAALANFWTESGPLSPTASASRDGGLSLPVTAWVKWLPQMNRMAYRKVAAVAVVHLLCTSLVSLRSGTPDLMTDEAKVQVVVQVCVKVLNVVCRSLVLIASHEELMEAKREQRAQTAASAVAAFSGMDEDSGLPNGVLLSDMLDLNNQLDSEDENIWENSDDKEPVKLLVCSEAFTCEPKRSLETLFSLLGDQVGAKVLGELSTEYQQVVSRYCNPK